MTEVLNDQTNGKRKQRTDDDASESGSKSKFANTKAAVPRIVMVDMNGDQLPQEAVAPVTAPTSETQIAQSPVEKKVANKVDWRKINNREILYKLIKTTPLKKGQAYVSFDVQEYERITGQRVSLGVYNHLKIEGPWMQNIFGISTRTTGTNTTHTINYDIKDCSQDSEVQEFAQFLALCDEIALEHAIKLAQASDEVARDTDWIEDSKKEDGTLDEARFRKKVAKNFNGTLRCSAKFAADKEKFAPVRWDDKLQRFVVPDAWFFRSKIRSKKNNDRLLDLTCHTDEQVPQAVFYMSEPALLADHASYCKPQIEFSSISFVGKEFYPTWVTQKFRFRTKEKLNQHANSDAADYDDMAAPVHASIENQRKLLEEEKRYLEKVQKGGAGDENVPTDE
jgi:hypothetical protein